MTLIKCKNTSFAYEGVPAVKNINFSVKQGDYLCIVGENGTGKSTLIKGLLNLKKPYQGEVIFASDLKTNEIGYLPQQTVVQKDFPASVYEVVISGCLNHLGWKPFFSQKEKQLALQNMEKLGVLDLKNACYRELSGGQQQRVLLARALCATKKMIIMDEPAAGLDPLVTAELYQIVKEINRQMGITIIMVSHDIHAALKYADHILHLHHEQLFFGTVDEYQESQVGKRFMRGVLDV